LVAGCLQTAEYRIVFLALFRFNGAINGAVWLWSRAEGVAIHRAGAAINRAFRAALWAGLFAGAGVGAIALGARAWADVFDE